MRLLKNMENSCLNIYSVEKVICNMNLSVLQELWILSGECLTVKKFEEEIFFQAEGWKTWKTCKKVVNLFTWCLHKTPKNRLVYISLHRIKINKIPISNWYCCVGSVAQLVEHLTFNQVVRGSRPRRPTTFLTDIISKKWVPQNFLTPKTLRIFADKLVFADKLRTK